MKLIGFELPLGKCSSFVIPVFGEHLGSNRFSEQDISEDLKISHFVENNNWQDVQRTDTNQVSAFELNVGDEAIFAFYVSKDDKFLVGTKADLGNQLRTLLNSIKLGAGVSLSITEFIGDEYQLAQRQKELLQHIENTDGVRCAKLWRDSQIRLPIARRILIQTAKNDTFLDAATAVISLTTVNLDHVEIRLSGHFHKRFHNKSENVQKRLLDKLKSDPAFDNIARIELEKCKIEALPNNEGIRFPKSMLIGNVEDNILERHYDGAAISETNGTLFIDLLDVTFAEAAAFQSLISLIAMRRTFGGKTKMILPRSRKVRDAIRLFGLPDAIYLATGIRFSDLVVKQDIKYFGESVGEELPKRVRLEDDSGKNMKTLRSVFMQQDNNFEGMQNEAKTVAESINVFSEQPYSTNSQRRLNFVNSYVYQLSAKSDAKTIQFGHHTTNNQNGKITSLSLYYWDDGLCWCDDKEYDELYTSSTHTNDPPKFDIVGSLRVFPDLRESGPCALSDSDNPLKYPIWVQKFLFEPRLSTQLAFIRRAFTDVCALQNGFVSLSSGSLKLWANSNKKRNTEPENSILINYEYDLKRGELFKGNFVLFRFLI